jgi:hypothetical protein
MLVADPPKYLFEFIQKLSEIRNQWGWWIVWNDPVFSPYIPLYKLHYIDEAKKNGAEVITQEEYIKLLSHEIKPTETITIQGYDFNEIVKIFQKIPGLAQDIRDHSVDALHRHMLKFYPGRERANEYRRLAELVECLPGTARKWSKQDHVVNDKGGYCPSKIELTKAIPLLYFLDPSIGKPLLSEFILKAERLKHQ